MGRNTEEQTVSHAGSKVTHILICRLFYKIMNAKVSKILINWKLDKLGHDGR